MSEFATLAAPAAVASLAALGVFMVVFMWTARLLGPILRVYRTFFILLVFAFGLYGGMILLYFVMQS